MDYTVKESENTSISGTEECEKAWTIGDMYNNVFTVEELVKTLEVVAKFRDKYENDEYIQVFEEIVRNEICKIFGGSIIDEDE